MTKRKSTKKHTEILLEDVQKLIDELQANFGGKVLEHQVGQVEDQMVLLRGRGLTPTKDGN